MRMLPPPTTKGWLTLNASCCRDKPKNQRLETPS